MDNLLSTGKLYKLTLERCYTYTYAFAIAIARVPEKERSSSWLTIYWAIEVQFIANLGVWQIATESLVEFKNTDLSTLEFLPSA